MSSLYENMQLRLVNLYLMQLKPTWLSAFVQLKDNSILEKRQTNLPEHYKWFTVQLKYAREYDGSVIFIAIG